MNVKHIPARVRLLMTMAALALLWAVGARAAPQSTAPVEDARAWSASQAARDWFVRAGGAGTACTQGSPCGLATALASANHGDSIYLAGGIYVGEGAAVITPQRNLILYGGWNGAASGAPQRDPLAHRTILDGQGQRRVMFLPPQLSVTLDGMTLRNGWAADDGGGIWADNSWLFLRGITLEDNEADSHGVGVTRGGGAFFTGGHLEVLGSTIRLNAAICESCGETYGGGLFIAATESVVIVDSVVESNDAWYGSGVYMSGVDSSTLAIRRSTLRYNGLARSASTGFGGYGGALNVHHGTLTIEDSRLESNDADNEGGGLQFLGARLTASRTVWRDNRSLHGSAIKIERTATFTLTNNLIADNRAPWFDEPSDAIYVPCIGGGCQGTLKHNTVAGNGGPAGGTGLLLSSHSAVTLTNNIVVSHTVGISANVGSTVNLNGTLWGSGAWANGSDMGGAGQFTLGPVNLHGLPGFANPAAGDYHLTAGALAINHGVDAGVHDDMDGEPRPMGGGYDIGADEFNPATPTPTAMPQATRTPTRTLTPTAAPRKCHLPVIWK